MVLGALRYRQAKQAAAIRRVGMYLVALLGLPVKHGIKVQPGSSLVPEAVSASGAPCMNEHSRVVWSYNV